MDKLFVNIVDDVPSHLKLCKLL